MVWYNPSKHMIKDMEALKILVMSDSHSGISFMRMAVKTLKPDAIIHLGDYVRDGDVIAEECPNIPFYQVPGNCDLHWLNRSLPEIQIRNIGGVKVYYTHGHRHGVKTYKENLYADARAADAQIVLYGHTHEADCHREPDGLWVLNPGSCGFYGGSVGVFTTEHGEVSSCRILRQNDLEGSL